MLGLDGGNTALGCLTLAGIELVPTVTKDAEGRITNVSYAVELAPTGGNRFKKAAGAAEYGYATTLGFATAAGATGAIATGWYSVAGNRFAFAGGEGSVAYGKNSIAYGERVIAAGANSLAIGSGGIGDNMEKNPKLIASGDNSVALGNSTKAFGANSVALNYNTEAGGVNSLAAGEKSKARADNSTALSGGIVAASATNSAAIGQGATANAANSMAIGKNAITTVADTVALGSNSAADRTAGEKLGYDPVSKAAFANDEAIAAALGKTAELADVNARLAPKQAAYDTAYNAYVAAEAAFNTTSAAYEAASKAYDANPTQENQQAMNNALAAYSDAFMTYYYQAIPAVNAASAGLKPVVQEKNTLLEAYKSSAGAIAVGDAAKGISRQIIGVAAGSEDTDAVNVAQLKALDTKVGSQLGRGFKLKSGTMETVVALDGTEAPTVEFASDDNLSVKLEDKKVTYGLNKVGITTTLGDTFAKVDASNLTDENVTSWKEKLGITGAQSGTAASWMIADKNGTVTTIAKDGQVKFVDGKNTTVEVTKDADGKAIVKVHMSDDVTFGKAGADGKDGHIGVNGKDGVSGVGIDGNDGISVKGDKGSIGLNGNDGISVNGKDGTPGVTIFGKDGVDGVNGAEGHIGLNGKDGLTDIRTGSGAAGVDGKNGETATRIVYKDPKGIEHQASTLDDGMKFNGDDGKVIAKKLNEQLAIRGGAKGALTTGNIGVTAKDGSLQIALAKELTGLASVTSQTVAASEKLVIGTGKAATTIRSATVTKGDGTTGTALDLGGARLTNVAAGTAATDAVTKGQVDALLGGVSSGIAGVEKRMNKTGAGAAALAALNPQDFDPDDKLDIAAGYGHYGNANALAVGAFYRPNDTTMVSVGGSFGGGENMLNVGVTMKVGKSNPYAGYSKAELVQTITSQKRRIEEIGKENRQLKEQMDEVMKQLAALQQK